MGTKEVIFMADWSLERAHVQKPAKRRSSHREETDFLLPILLESSTDILNRSQLAREQ